VLWSTCATVATQGIVPEKSVRYSLRGAPASARRLDKGLNSNVLLWTNVAAVVDTQFMFLTLQVT
jgi:hypothetical protein